MYQRPTILALLAAMLLCFAPALAQPPALADDIPVTDTPWPDDPQKFTFAILGDRRGGGYENWPLFDRAVEEIARLRPDFVITVGDQIQGYTEDPAQVQAQWDEYQQHLAPIGVPVFYTAGNHDVEFDGGTEYWNEHFGRTYYDFTYKGCHFIVLNTDAVWRGEDGKPMRHTLLGEEQVAWAVSVLQNTTDARHTFIFMHKPAWYGEDPEWAAIEQALGDRPRTVVGGHWHDLQHETRNGNDYFVHGATGGSLTPSPVKELGAFHQYTMVSVESNQVRFAVQEPGSSWSVEIAPAGFADSARALTGRPYYNQWTADGKGIVSVSTEARNALPGPARVVLRSVLTSDNWTASADSVSAMLEPGESQEIELRFTADQSDRVPIPEIQWDLYYGDARLRTLGPHGIRPFDVDAIRIMPDWYVIGPFDSGEIDRSFLPENPEAGVPGMFVPHGPDEGWKPNAEYEEGGRTLYWRSAQADSNGRLNLDDLIGMRDNQICYAECMVYSREPRRTALLVSADNFSQTFLNGQLIGESFGGPDDWDYLPLDLKEGWNNIRIKIANHMGNWHLITHIIDEEGDLRFSRPEP